LIEDYYSIKLFKKVILKSCEAFQINAKQVVDYFMLSFHDFLTEIIHFLLNFVYTETIKLVGFYLILTNLYYFKILVFEYTFWDPLYELDNLSLLNHET